MSLKYKICGGVGEHGRNCFFIEDDNISYLFDCGIMKGAENPYPHISEDEIKELKYIFLSHSHLDHSGALLWLYKKGFRGYVVCTSETYNQLSAKPKNSILIKNFNTWITLEKNLNINCGRSGHCSGAIWFNIKTPSGKTLFTGDYIETSNIYPCDKIREMDADIAFIDCAYGYDKKSCIENSSIIVKEVLKNILNNKNIIFPVPKYGRGLELIELLKKQLPQISIFIDSILLEQIKQYHSLNLYNYKKTGSDSSDDKPVLYFICDPQLEREKNIKLISQIKGQIIFTGTVEEGSYAEELLKNKEALFLRFNVHQNYDDAKKLIEENNFKKVILTHSKEIFL